MNSGNWIQDKAEELSLAEYGRKWEEIDNDFQMIIYRKAVELYQEYCVESIGRRIEMKKAPANERLSELNTSQ